MSEELYQSFFAEIYINGKALDEQRVKSITDLTITNPIDGSTTATLTLVDTEAEFIQDDIFLRNARINITTGINEIIGSIEKFNGIISAIDIDFGDTGAPTLSITCMDETFSMDRSKKKRTWQNTTSVAVVAQIAAEYGLSFSAPDYDFEVQDTISQSKVTDIKFIEDLGQKERDPFKVKVIDGVLYYEPLEFNSAPVGTYMYREYPYDIKSFKPKINRETITVESNAAGIVSDTKKEENITATQDNTPRDTTQGEPVKTNVYVYNTETGQWDVLVK